MHAASFIDHEGQNRLPIKSCDALSLLPSNHDSRCLTEMDWQIFILPNLFYFVLFILTMFSLYLLVEMFRQYVIYVRMKEDFVLGSIHPMDPITLSLRSLRVRKTLSYYVK